MQFNFTPPLFDVMVALKLEIISSISIGLDIIENGTKRHCQLHNVN